MFSTNLSRNVSLSHEASEPALARVRFTVTSDLEPSVLSRVVEMFALRGLVPVEVSATREEGIDLHLRVELVVDGLETGTCAHLCRRMRNIVPVREVMLELL